MSSPIHSSRARRLAVLHEVALALSGETDRRRLHERVVQGVRRLLDTDLVSVLSWDPGSEQLVVEVTTVPTPGLAWRPADLPVCIGRAFMEKATVAVDDFAAHPSAPPNAAEMGFGAAMATPILREGKPYGVLWASHRRTAAGPGAFDAEDRGLLEILAGHLGLALANAETLATAIRRTARAEELAIAARGIVEARHRDLILTRTLDCATTILGADRAAIYLLGPDEEVTYVAARRLSRHYLDRVLKSYRRSAGGLMLLTRSPIYVADMATDPRTRPLHDLVKQEQFRSMLLVPLIYRNELRGALALYHDLVWHYDLEDIASVRALGDHAALSLANAALDQQTQRQLAQLRALEAMMRAVSEPVDEYERCKRGVQAIVTGGGAPTAWVYCLHGDELALVTRAGATSLAGDAAADAARAAIRDGRSVTHAVPHAEPLLATPIAYRGQILGALVLASLREEVGERRASTIFLNVAEDAPTDPFEFARTAAHQLATAVMNARLYDEARSLGGRLVAVLSGIPSGVLVFDRDDRIVFFNEHVREIYGLKGRDLTGWSPADFVREVTPCFRDPQTPIEIARRVRAWDGGMDKITFELKHPARRVIERIASPVRTSDGDLLGQVVLYHELDPATDASGTSVGADASASTVAAVSASGPPAAEAAVEAEASARAVGGARPQAAASRSVVVAAGIGAPPREGT